MNIYKFFARKSKKGRLALLKDDLLLEIFTQRKVVKELFNDIEYCQRKKVSMPILFELIQQLERMGFVKRLTYERDGKKTEYWGAMAKGYFFLNEEGGFIQLYINKIRQNIWMAVKTTMIAINAVAITYITILTYQKQNEITDLQKEIMADQRTIKRIETVNKNLGKKIIELETRILKNSEKGKIKK